MSDSDSNSDTSDDDDSVIGMRRGRSDSSDSSSPSPPRRRREVQMVKLAQIFIIKIDPETNCIVSILPWDGRDPNDGYSILVAYGVKISDTTYNSYTPIPTMVSQHLERLEKFKNSRTILPERSFGHMRNTYPSGDSFSILFTGCTDLEPKRSVCPYRPHGLHGPKEPLQNLFLQNLMRKISRYDWYRDNFKIYASTKRKPDGRPESCWYLVNGPDTWDEHSQYIKDVEASEVPLDDACDIRKPYCVLYNFTPNKIEGTLFSRQLPPGFSIAHFRTTSHPTVPAPGGGSKSRRRLKRRFKRKTIKRINKRKTIKRRFKKR